MKDSPPASSPEDFYPPIPPESSETQDDSWGDRMLKGDLTPRHRKLAEMIAQGKKNSEIAHALNYTESRVSILRSNSRIKDLVEVIRERVFEESIGARLKKLVEPALNEIERCLSDKTGAYTVKDKLACAQWLAEKIDGKATQKVDVGENMLSIFMDRLDAIKASGQQVIDVTPGAPKSLTQSVDETGQKESGLMDWVKLVRE